MQPNHYSFDLFDTLITRPLREPHELFIVMEILLLGRYPELKGFAKNRRKAEREARLQSKHSEVRLQEIYKFLELPCLVGLNEPVSDYLQMIEKSLELACTLPVRERIDYYKDIIQQSSSTFIVSDTYLDHPLILKILTHNSIPPPSRIYLSSDHLKSKAKGDLWQLVRSENSGKIFHIGDNINSDYLNAQKHNISSALVTRTCNKFRPLSKSSDARSLRPFFNQLAAERFKSYWAQLGFGLVAPTMVELCRFLNAIKERTASERIIFLARDGYIIKRAYNRLYASDTNTEYMFASRRMLNFPRITSIDKDAKNFLLSGTTLQTFRAYLERLDIPCELASKFLDARGRRIDQLVKNSADRVILENLIEQLGPIIIEQASIERARLKQYFDRLGLLTKGCLIVDVGWHGSLQQSINSLTTEFIGQDIPVHGAYFGLFFPSNSDSYKHSFFIRNRLDEFIVRRGVELIELLFAGPELPIKTVDERGNAVRFNAHEKEVERVEICKSIIDGLDYFFKFFEEARIDPINTDFQGYIRSGWQQLIMLPNRNSLKHFGPVHHSEGFGNQIFRRIISSGYKESYWKLGYLATKFYSNIGRDFKS
jgi:predicted HAD superfamily hydrolase